MTSLWSYLSNNFTHIQNLLTLVISRIRMNLEEETTIILPRTGRYIPDDYVNINSPKYLKEIVYKLARYFRREFEYDFTQFDPNED